MPTWEVRSITAQPGIILVRWRVFETELIYGISWTRAPSLVPAVLVGMSTVVAPLFVMQPAMGSGFAASKTPTPLKNCIRSAVNHTIFGLGLYLSAALTAWIAR